jgi:hypothetical protein
VVEAFLPNTAIGPVPRLRRSLGRLDARRLRRNPKRRSSANRRSRKLRLQWACMQRQQFRRFGQLRTQVPAEPTRAASELRLRGSRLLMDSQSLRFSGSGLAFALFASAVTLPLCLFVGLYGAGPWRCRLRRAEAARARRVRGAGMAGGVTLVLYAHRGGCWVVRYRSVAPGLRDRLFDGAGRARGEPAPPLMRRKTIAWSDVTGVERSQETLTSKIRISKRYVWLTMSFYKYPREVERFVREHASPGTRFTGDAGGSWGAKFLCSLLFIALFSGVRRRAILGTSRRRRSRKLIPMVQCSPLAM